METETDFFKKIADLRSALVLYLTYPEKYQDADTICLDVHNDSTSLVHVSKSFWGIWDIIHVKTFYRGMNLTKSVLVGKDPYRSDSLALFMPDRSQSIFASGNTFIRGNIKISQKGLQQAAIEGKPLSIMNLHEGRILPGEKDIPGLNCKIVQKILFWQSYDSLIQYSININQFLEREIICRDIQSPMIFADKKSFQLSGIQATGQVAFVTPELVIIKNDTRLDGIIISAGKVLVEDSFTGHIQIFCRDSIVVGANCKLEYPSCLVIYNAGVNPAYIELGDSSVIEGIIICHQSQFSSAPAYFKIGKHARVVGQIYHNGTIELKGIIHGSLICRAFYLQTHKAYYMDHLLDNEIDFLQLPQSYVGIDFQNGYNDQIIAYLEEDVEEIDE